MLSQLSVLSLLVCGALAQNLEYAPYTVVEGKSHIQAV